MKQLHEKPQTLGHFFEPLYIYIGHNNVVLKLVRCIESNHGMIEVITVLRVQPLTLGVDTILWCSLIMAEDVYIFE